MTRRLGRCRREGRLHPQVRRMPGGQVASESGSAAGGEGWALRAACGTEAESGEGGESVKVADDPSLTVEQVMATLGISRAFAYEVMRRAGGEVYGRRCVRLRSSKLEAWRTQHELTPECESTSEAPSGGRGGRRAAARSAEQRGSETGKPPSGPSTGGKGSARIRSITPRTRRRSEAPPPDSSRT